MSWSISRRLILWLAVPLVALSVAGALSDYFMYVAPAAATSERRLKATVHALAQRYTFAECPTIINASTLSDATKYVIRDARGQVLCGDKDLPIIRLSEQVEETKSVVRINNRDTRLFAKRVDTSAGPIVIVAGEPLETNQSTMHLSLLVTLLVNFVQLDITFVLIWIGIRFSLRPLKRLSEEIESRSPVDLRPLIEHPIPQEIAPLAATINRLLAKVRSLMHTHQQFIANVAHQLRTPITGMVAQLDLLSQDAAAEPIKGRLAVLQEGMRQLTHSTNQLLMLARADSGENQISRNKSVDLARIVDEVVPRFLDRAVAANIDLGANACSLSIVADVGLLDDLLSNLIDNALKYTPPGGSITVSVGQQDHQPFLEVDDNGAGIPESERQRVRTRFYRSPNSPGHGSGLGLAIVDEIARLYRASLSIETGSSGRGTRVRVRFPASSVSSH